MIVIGDNLIGKSGQYLTMEWSLGWSGRVGVAVGNLVCVGVRSWNIENSVCNNKLLGVPNKIRLGHTKFSFTQHLDLIKLCKCRVTIT